MTLPRVHAVTDARVLALPGFLDLARHVATLGQRVAIHLRDRTASGRSLADHAVTLCRALAGTGTALIINARPDIAAAVEARGVQLGAGDITVTDARQMFGGWVGRSVHSVDAAREATQDGADYLIGGTTYASASHAGDAPQGPAFIGTLASVSPRIIAIGGITAANASAVHAAGAYGVAAISGIWDASDPVGAVTAMLAPWGKA